MGYILSYGIPKHGRTQILVAALQKIPSLELYQARNNRKGMLRYLQTFWRLIKIHRRYHPNIYLVGFRGHEFYPLVRLIVGRKAVLIFDEFVSPYDSWTCESKKFGPNSLAAKIIYQIERFILRNADVLLTDTGANARYYAHLFDISENKFNAVPIGVDETVFNPFGPRHAYNSQNEFVVFTYATFKPLHGTDLILEAAAALQDLPVRFFIAGGTGKALTLFHERIKILNLSNVTHTTWIDFDELPQYIRGADLCLGGPFGNTAQGQRIITGKTVQFLACGKATIVGQSNEDPGLVHQKNCLLVEQGSALALANTIRWAYEHQEQLDEIGRQGHQLFGAHYTLDTIVHSVTKILSHL
jgi:glycosyltransferase involved in cell wall biosynthesis